MTSAQSRSLVRPKMVGKRALTRATRWTGQPDWGRVLDTVCLNAESDPETRDAPLSREVLAEGLRAMAPRLADVLRMGAEVGMESDVLEHLRPAVARLVRELENLR